MRPSTQISKLEELSDIDSYSDYRSLSKNFGKSLNTIPYICFSAAKLAQVTGTHVNLKEEF